MKFALVLLVLALCGTVQGRDGKWLILSIHLIWLNNLSYCDIYFPYNIIITGTPTLQAGVG